MIDNSDIKVLYDFALNRMTIEEFNKNFSYNLAPDSMFRLFRWATTNRSEILLFSVTQYFYKTRFIDGVCCIYNDLLLQDWHKYHDTIAGILQFELKAPTSVIYFKESINLKFPYLVKSGDYEPYVSKCMWGISKIKSEYSQQVLFEFNQSEDEIVRNAALFQIDRLGLEKKST